MHENKKEAILSSCQANTNPKGNLKHPQSTRDRNVEVKNELKEGINDGGTTLRISRFFALVGSHSSVVVKVTLI